MLLSIDIILIKEVMHDSLNKERCISSPHVLQTNVEEQMQEWKIISSEA